MSLPVSENSEMAHAQGGSDLAQPPTRPELGEFVQSSSELSAAAVLQSMKGSALNRKIVRDEDDSTMSDEPQIPPPGDEARTTTAPFSTPGPLGVVSMDKPRPRASATTAASTRSKRAPTTSSPPLARRRASKVVKTVKKERKQRQQSASSSYASGSNDNARLFESAVHNHLNARNSEERTSTINNAMQSLNISTNTPDPHRHCLTLRYAAARVEPAANAPTANTSLLNNNNDYSNPRFATTNANMSPDEQLQFQQLLSAAPSRPRRARDTMNINFILNEDSPRDSATASASASNADAGPTYSFSELSDFDKQFFFRPSRHTTSRTSSTMAVASTASSTTLSPPSDYSSPHLANGVGNTVNTWIETKMSDYNYNNRNNVHSTRDRPWDRNVEMYMRPEQRLYEDTLLEILNGLELPFNA